MKEALMQIKTTKKSNYTIQTLGLQERNLT